MMFMKDTLEKYPPVYYTCNSVNEWSKQSRLTDQSRIRSSTYVVRLNCMQRCMQL